MARHPKRTAHRNSFADSTEKNALHHNSAHNCRSSLDSNSLAQTHWAAPLLVCYLFVGLRHVFRPEIRSSPLFFRQLLFSVPPPSPLVVWNMIRPEAVSAVPGQSQQQQQLVSSVKKNESPDSDGFAILSAYSETSIFGQLLVWQVLESWKFGVFLPLQFAHLTCGLESCCFDTSCQINQCSLYSCTTRCKKRGSAACQQNPELQRSRWTNKISHHTCAVRMCPDHSNEREIDVPFFPNGIIMKLC